MENDLVVELGPLLVDQMVDLMVVLKESPQVAWKADLMELPPEFYLVAG